MSCKAESKGSYERKSLLLSDTKSEQAKSDSKSDRSCSSQNGPLIRVEVLDIAIQPDYTVNIEAPLSIIINFEIFDDVDDSFWMFKFLVDSCDKRMIRVSRWCSHDVFVIHLHTRHVL